MIDAKLQAFINQNSSDGKGDDLTKTVNSISIGYVVDTDDPLEMGRLRVFCGSFNDNPKKLHHIPWATYSTPYGGSINNSAYTRGNITGKEHTTGAVHYGFWGIPEQGAHVLVACINGDIRRRVWLGCVPEHQETHTLFTGRFDWNGGYPDGPLSSTKSPIEPAYTNASKAFNGDKKSSEWKTRIATYQPMSVREDLGEIPNPSKSRYLDNQFKEISKNERDDWVKGILGSHGYDWSGYKKLGSFKSSRVFGMSTPGFHAFLMDDRPFNSRIQFKTTAGHQILLDDTNERIYISTYEGKSYIEMDKSGNIDMYCDKRLSMHSKQDINIESDETVRIKGKKGIHMYAGDTTGQTPLDEVPPDGQIRLHSTDDMHFYSENNLRVLVENSAIFEFGGTFCTSVGEDYNLQVENDINTITNDGNMNTSITGSLLLNASTDISQFAGNNTKHQSVNDVEVMAYRGKMDVGSQLEMTISSKGENVGIESINKAINLSGGEKNSIITLDDKGATVASDTKVSIVSKDKVAVNVSSDISVQELKDSNGGCVTFPGVNVLFANGAIEHDVEDDITYKLPNGVVETVDKINEKFGKIQNRWDEHMLTVAENMASVFTAITSLDPLDLVIPPLLGFPVPPPAFSFGLPALNLPTFNLPNVCFDLSNVLNIDYFNPIPETLFQLNIDLGGWSKDSIKGWVNSLKNEVNELKDSFDFSQLQNALQTEINDILSDFGDIRDSLINMVDINITGNTTEYFNYGASIDSLTISMDAYNNAVVLIGGQPISSPLNNITSYQDNTADIINNMSPTEVDNFDFNQLQSSVETLGEIIVTLGGSI